MNVESPVGFFYIEHDDKSFSDNISKSSIKTNNITSILSINTMAFWPIQEKANMQSSKN